MDPSTYRQMIELASDAILAIEPATGRILSANPMAVEMTGYDKDTLTTLSVWDLHPPDEQEIARALFEEVRTSGRGARQDAHFLRLDGSKIDIEITASLIRYPGGMLIQRICRDVTERKARETERAQQREMAEILLEISTTFNWLSAAEVPDALNAAMERVGLFLEVERCYIYVLEADAMSRAYIWALDSRFRDIWLPDDGRVPLDSFEWGLQVLRRGEILEYNKPEDPKKFEPESTAPPVMRYSFMLPIVSKDVLDAFIGFDVLEEPRIWDDSQVELLKVLGNVFGSALRRRNAELALTQANEDLESKVELRTRELRDKQAQLVQTEKMASLGQLVAGVAHELNTPLGTLKSALQTFGLATKRMQGMAEAPEPVDERRLGKTLGALGPLVKAGTLAVDRIDGLVKGLRSFARLDRAPIDRVDLTEGLTATLSLVSHEAKNRIRFDKELTPLPGVKCHPDQINQVFMNVLLNAIQAIEGEGVVTLSAEVREDEVLVQIQDSGRGIPAENLARVFDPGFTTRGVGVGAGLGLSIAHQIIDEHQGRIEVMSPKTGGTVVQVWLPIEHEHAH